MYVCSQKLVGTRKRCVGIWSLLQCSIPYSLFIHSPKISMSKAVVRHWLMGWSGLWTHNLLHSSPEPLTEQTLKHSTKWCFTVFILVCVLFDHLATGWHCSKKVIPFQRQWKPLYHTAILPHSCWEERKSKEITFINTWLKMASLILFLQTNQVSFEGCYCTGGVQKR